MTINFKNTGFRKFCIAIAILASCPEFLLSQSDFESWNGITANVNLNKKTSFEFSNELRLNNNATGLKKYMAELGAEHKFAKFIEAGITYRYSRLNELEYFSNEHLLYGKIALSGKLGRFSASLQTRYQRAFEVFGFSTLYKWSDTWRNKAVIEYNIYGMPLAVYSSFELFTDNELQGLETNKYRLFGGAKYKINRTNTLNISYGCQSSFNKPNTRYILGLTYRLNFNFR